MYPVKYTAAWMKSPWLPWGAGKRCWLGPACGTDPPLESSRNTPPEDFLLVQRKVVLLPPQIPPPLSGLVAVMGIISDAKMPLFGVGARQQSDGKLRHQPCGGLLERLRTPGVAAA